jgi:hypothetical protein
MKPNQTLPDSEAPRKHRRWFLWGPWIAFVLLLVVGGGAWVSLRVQAVRHMDAQAERLRAAGYDIAWSERRISGFPFRLEAVLTNVRIAEPSGWAIEAPEIQAEAAVYALGRWVAYAPRGVSLTRPGSGTVRIEAKVLRASLSGLDRAPPPRISIEGQDLTFIAPPGAKPYPLHSAKNLQIHTRGGPDDQGEILFRLEGGQAELPALMGRIAQGKPIAIVWDSVFSKASALKGRDWPSAVQAWTDAGGKLTVRNVAMTAGDAQLNALGGTLSVGFDGRLRGDLPVELRQAPRALIAMGEAGAAPPEAAAAAAAVVAARQDDSAAARASITFEAGQATLGPVALGSAPRVY